MDKIIQITGRGPAEVYGGCGASTQKKNTERHKKINWKSKCNEESGQENGTVHPAFTNAKGKNGKISL
jgi:hypothetical protein